MATTPARKPAKKAAPGGKSGMRTFKPAEVIFNQNDPADSLFIIQKGQIRLYIPKGRGFVELAILRAGEVIGEMGYFDEKASRRSCSAASMVTTDVIEISYAAFGKTMAGLNPWFKTIINTLADRLRKTNDKVKALEVNSVGRGEGGKVGDYTFMNSQEVIRILSLIYLTMNAHAEEKDGFYQIHKNKLKFYMLDIFNIQEVKYEEFLNMLQKDKFIEIAEDADGFPKIIKIQDLEFLRSNVVFFNTQRITEDSKKLSISPKCERLLKKMIDQVAAKGEDKPKAMVDVSVIIDDFNTRNIPITDEDIADAVTAGLCEDILVGEGNKLTAVLYYDKAKKVYPSLKLQNALAALNDSKRSGAKY